METEIDCTGSTKAAWQLIDNLQWNLWLMSLVQTADVPVVGETPHTGDMFLNPVPPIKIKHKMKVTHKIFHLYDMYVYRKQLKW